MSQASTLRRSTPFKTSITVFSVFLRINSTADCHESKVTPLKPPQQFLGPPSGDPTEDRPVTRHTLEDTYSWSRDRRIWRIRRQTVNCHNHAGACSWCCERRTRCRLFSQTRLSCHGSFSGSSSASPQKVFFYGP